MYLTVVATHLLLEVDYTVRLCQWVSADAARIDIVFLWKVMFDPGVLCQITERHMYRDIFLFTLFF